MVSDPATLVPNSLVVIPSPGRYWGKKDKVTGQVTVTNPYGTSDHSPLAAVLNLN